MALLRVASDGRIIGGNPRARRWLGPLMGRDCYRTLQGRGMCGTSICRQGCAQNVLASSAAPRPQLALVRGQRCYLQCERVGEELVVMLRAVDQEEESGERLTPRERQALSLVAEGLTRVEIAARLGLQPATVRTHLERARARLGARTLAQAVALWLSPGH